MSKESRYLTRILRHTPEEIGLDIGRSGWVTIDKLLKALRENGRQMTRKEFDQIVRDDDKKRFTISSDGRRVRAAQGHSFEIDLGLQPIAPPKVLFHGTGSHSLDAIYSEGLVPRGRRHVHLSEDEATAVSVGARKGQVIVLRVAAGDLHAEGHVFFRADNGVWLTERVPANFLEIIGSG